MHWLIRPSLSNTTRYVVLYFIRSQSARKFGTLQHGLPRSNRPAFVCVLDVEATRELTKHFWRFLPVARHKVLERRNVSSFSALRSESCMRPVASIYPASFRCFPQYLRRVKPKRGYLAIVVNNRNRRELMGSDDSKAYPCILLDFRAAGSPRIPRSFPSQRP